MYKQLDASEYTELQKALKKRKGSHLQKEFITAALSNTRFIDFVRHHAKTEGDKDVPVLPSQVTEDEYKDPPKDTEIKIYNAWKDIPVNSICNASFWAEVTLKHIEAGWISAHFLAANGGSLPGGKQRIERALSQLGNNNDVDACVRTILRRMSGFPVERGNKSVYSDCPLGRALWRRRLLEEMAQATGMDKDKFRKVLVLNPSYWEKLVESVVSRNSILGSVTARYALIWALSDMYEQNKKHKALTQTGLGKIVRLLGVRSAWQELGVLELHEIKSLIEENMFPQLYQ